MGGQEFPDPSSDGAFQYTCRVFEYFASQGEVAIIEALKDELEAQLEVAKKKLDEPIELTPEMKEVLRERLEEHQRNPQQGIPWDEVRRRIVAKRTPRK